MKKSLTLKMFATLFLSFALITTVIMLFIYCYFNFYYREIKIDRITMAINEFAEEYQQKNWSEYELYQRLSTFNDTNNVSLTVYENGGAFYSEESASLIKNISPSVEGIQSSYLITTLSDGIYYDLVISAEENQKFLESTGTSLSGTLNISGFLYADNLIIPSEINGFVFNGSSSDILIENETEPQPVTLTAEYIDTGVFSNVSNSFDQTISAKVSDDESAMSAVGGVYETELVSPVISEKNSVSYYLTAIPYTNLEQVYLTKTVEISNRIITFDAYMSLHSVSEINGIMTSFLPWFLLASSLMALIISAVFSRTVSKPILRITEAADCMASMELDIKSEVTRKDELGRLSDSLNTLASNLNSAMKELVAKNKKLADDFARKEREEESRKAFIANASHELKTPLGVIKGYTEAIKDGVRADKNAYYMDVILDEISRMDSLLEDMMQLSKSEAGVNTPEFEPVNLDEMFHVVTSKLEPAATLRNLVFQIKSPIGNVMGDSRALYQVVFNLTANAVKYATADTIISVESITAEDKNEIYIKNTCAQFSSEDLIRVWERFYKVDASHNRDSEGSGLGLAIVKSILESHKAEYGVYNTPKGVCFYFKLPLS